MKKFLIILITFVPIIALAHDANKAYYKINQLETTVEVTAEFPWTLRNSLLKFEPTLRESKSQEDYDKAFFEYVKLNLVLTDSEGNQYDLIEIKAIISNDHSHQNDFKLIFSGKDVHTISNSILLNLDNNQENIHVIALENDSIEFVTSNENNTFKINSSSFASMNFLWLLVLLAIPAGIIKKRFTN